MLSIIIYFLFLLIGLISAYAARGWAKRWNGSILSSPILLFFIFFFSIIVGFRWNVGTDYPNYYELIIGGKSLDLERIEFIPRFLIEIIQVCNLPFYTWFIAMAFLQIIFIIYAVELGKLRFLLPWVIFWFICVFQYQSMNIIRQFNALSCVLCAYACIKDRKIYLFLLFTVLAILFHRTAIFVLPLYYIANRRILPDNRIVHFLIIAVFLFTGPMVYESVMSELSAYTEAINYLKYIEQERTVEIGSGLGVVLTYMRYFVIVYLFPVLKNKYMDKGFVVFYNILFVDICLYNTFASDMVFSRFLLYFTFADLFVSSFLMHYLSRKCKTVFQHIVFIMFIVVYVAVLFKGAYSIDWQFV